MFVGVGMAIVGMIAHVIVGVSIVSGVTRIIVQCDIRTVIVGIIKFYIFGVLVLSGIISYISRRVIFSVTKLVNNNYGTTVEIERLLSGALKRKVVDE